MQKIAITGASGNVGREILGAFDDEVEVVPFSRSEYEDLDTELLDVTDREEVLEALAGFDVVVHLAGASSPEADWETVAEVNIHGTKHVLDAAVEGGVERVVFASSNHAVGTYNAEEGEQDTERMTTGYAAPVSGNAPPRPDSFYGASKVACEGLANFYADVHGLEVVTLRIGWYLTPEDLRETVAGMDDPGKERFARALWLGPHDCRDVHRQAATVELPENPITVNAVSRNDERFHSITETMRLLEYRPRENSAEVLDE